MNLTIQAAKLNFFDKKKVLLAVGKARVQALSKAGAFVRTRARSSIRKRKKVSAPGKPPSSHKGLLKQFLFFAYDEGSKSVVIGPARIRNNRAPEALEYGGTATVFSHGKRVPARIRARPFMHPALAAEAPNFAGLWANSVR